MRGAWIAVALVAACTSPSGLTIEVVPIDGVTRVELFLARKCDGTCPGRVAPPATRELDARLFEVDHARMWGAKVDGNVAGFRIVADGTDEQKIPLLVAVGYAGDLAVATAVLTDVRIVPGASDYWRVQLADAAPLDLGRVADDETYRLAQWRTGDDTLPSCVVIEHAGERLAIGPATDEDCDEVMIQPECKPWSFRAAGMTASIDTANCFTTAAIDAFTNACVAAGPPCDEVSDERAACSRIADDYCLTNPLCTCPSWDPACLSPNTFNSDGPYLKCIVPLGNNGEPCAAPTVFTAVAPCNYLGGAQSTCKSIRLHELGPTIGPFGMSASFGISTLAITAYDAMSSTIDLEWSGTPGNQVALVSLDLSNGRHIVMPLQLTFAEPCGPATCDVHFGPDSDPALACASAPPATPTCQPESPCNAGPLCGSVCCGTGEQCVNGTCRCGTGARCTDGECAAGSAGPCGAECCNGNTGVLCLF